MSYLLSSGELVRIESDVTDKTVYITFILTQDRKFTFDFSNDDKTLDLLIELLTIIKNDTV